MIGIAELAAAAVGFALGYAALGEIPSDERRTLLGTRVLTQPSIESEFGSELDITLRDFLTSEWALLKEAFVLIPATLGVTMIAVFGIFRFFSLLEF